MSEGIANWGSVAVVQEAMDSHERRTVTRKQSNKTHPKVREELVTERIALLCLWQAKDSSDKDVMVFFCGEYAWAWLQAKCGASFMNVQSRPKNI